MAQPVLLDTCAAIWLAEGEVLAKPAIEVLRRATEQGSTTYVSPITAWEVGQLVAKSRLKIYATPARWFSEVLDRGARLADMSPDLLIASSVLPGRPPRDPADRIILATARDLGATIVTRDRTLLDYGRQGHVSVVRC